LLGWDFIFTFKMLLMNFTVVTNYIPASFRLHEYMMSYPKVFCAVLK